MHVFSLFAADISNPVSHVLQHVLLWSSYCTVFIFASDPLLSTCNNNGSYHRTVITLYYIIFFLPCRVTLIAGFVWDLLDFHRFLSIIIERLIIDCLKWCHLIQHQSGRNKKAFWTLLLGTVLFQNSISDPFGTESTEWKTWRRWEGAVGCSSVVNVNGLHLYILLFTVLITQNAFHYNSA